MKKLQKHRNNGLYKARSKEKQTWAGVMLIGILMILLVGTVSAFEIDNVKSYDKETKTATIKNAFGLGADILTARLDTPQIYNVGLGYQKVAEFTLNPKQDYQDIINEIKYYNLNDGEKEVERQIDIKYLTYVDKERDTYTEVCNSPLANGTTECFQAKSGTEIIQEVRWLDFDNSVKTNKEITLGLFTNTIEGDHIEWIPKIAGVKVNEWAEWTASLNVNLISYYTLNNSAGVVKDSLGKNDGVNQGATRGIAGIIDDSFRFDADSTEWANTTFWDVLSNNFTISLWMNTSFQVSGGGQDSIISRNDGTNVLIESIEVVDGSDTITVLTRNGTAGNNGQVVGTVNVTDNLWHHVVMTRNDTYLRLYVDGADDGSQNQAYGVSALAKPFTLGQSSISTLYYNGSIDEVAIWNRTLTGVEVTQLYNGGVGITVDIDVDTLPVVTDIFPSNNTNFSVSSILTNATISDDKNVTKVELYVDSLINQINQSQGVYNNSVFTFNVVLADGVHTLQFNATDNNSRSTLGNLNYVTIDTVLPAITLSYPIGQIESHVIGTALDLNWTVIDANTEYCWYDYNSINTTVTCADNTTTFNTVANKQDITFYANDSAGNMNSAITSWTYVFLETGVDFNATALETSAQSFTINISTDLTVLSISSLFDYNGTNHSSTASCDMGNCTLANAIDLPLVSLGEYQNKSFSWFITIFNGTNSISLQTSTRNQNVTRLHLEACNATYTDDSLNFTAWDEQALTQFDPYDFNGTFEFWKGGGTVVRSNSFINRSKEFKVCIDPSEDIKTDAIINYRKNGTDDNYTSRFYYLDEFEMNSTLQDIPMYLLLSADSTSFILKVQDESLLPVEGALIEIHRYYPGEGIFRIVQIARTDDNGKSIGFFETETVDYKFVIKKDGVTLLETTQQKIVPETSPFTLTFNTGEPLDEPWESQQDISDLNSSLSWDSTTGIVTYIYIDNSGNFTLARLLVVQESLVNSTADSTLCNTNLSISSGTLTCTVGSTNGFYIASSFITRGSSETLDRQFTFQIETLSGVVGLLGLFFGWFLILIAAFMFKFNEIAGIWAITITVFLVNIIGLINFGGVFVTATIALAMILTWIMEK